MTKRLLSLAFAVLFAIGIIPFVYEQARRYYENQAHKAD